MDDRSVTSQVLGAVVTFLFPFLVVFLGGCLAILIIKGWIQVWKALP